MICYHTTILYTRRLKQLLDEVENSEHRTLIREIQLLLLISEDDKVNYDDESSVGTSLNVSNNEPNGAIDNKMIDMKDFEPVFNTIIILHIILSYGIQSNLPLLVNIKLEYSFTQNFMFCGRDIIATLIMYFG